MTHVELCCIVDRDDTWWHRFRDAKHHTVGIVYFSRDAGNCQPEDVQLSVERLSCRRNLDRVPDDYRSLRKRIANLLHRQVGLVDATERDETDSFRPSALVRFDDHRIADLDPQLATLSAVQAHNVQPVVFGAASDRFEQDRLVAGHQPNMCSIIEVERLEQGAAQARLGFADVVKARSSDVSMCSIFLSQLTLRD